MYSLYLKAAQCIKLSETQDTFMVPIKEMYSVDYFPAKKKNKGKAQVFWWYKRLMLVKPMSLPKRDSMTKHESKQF